MFGEMLFGLNEWLFFAIIIGLLLCATELRNLLPTLVSVILIASVILLIIDLDRPRRGLIKVSQRMADFQDSLKRSVL